MDANKADPNAPTDMTPTTKISARPRLSSDERRASIIEAAVRLFSERGFRGTTTRELASAVGVTEPVLYEHFKTKRDLYAAIVEAKAQEGLQYASEVTARYRHADDDEGFFNDLGNLIIDWYTRDPSFIRLLLFSNLEGDDLKELFHERTKACFDLVGSYIARRVRAGAMQQVQPEIAARAYFGMIAHYALTGLVFGFARFDLPATEVVAQMSRMFLTGLCKDKNI